MICTICAEEDDANHAKAKAAYHAAGGIRLRAAMGNPDALLEAVTNALQRPGMNAEALIELVRTHDQQRALIEAGDDERQAQANTDSEDNPHDFF